MKCFLLLLLLTCISATKSFSQCATSTSHAQLNINNINADIDNAGGLWLGYLFGVPSYEAPKGDSVGAISAGGLWIGGIDPGGQLHLAASTYRQNGNDFTPGPINYNTHEPSPGFDTVWVMLKSTVDSFKAGLFSSIPRSIKYWPGYGNTYQTNLSYSPGQPLAPFVDVNNNGIYDPANGDYPDIKGDEATWEVFNDDCSPHTESGGLPLEIEVQLMTYAFNDTGCLNNTTFYQYEITNFGSVTYDSTYIGIFVDPDLGCSTDDYIGCDSTLNMGICYNGEAVDCDSGKAGSYGKYPPILGVQMTNLPVDPSRDSAIGMSSFVYWNNDFTDMGNPVSANQYYGYLTATWKDGTPFTKYGNGHGGPQHFRYTYPSDPTDTLEQAWSECSGHDVYGDRRFMMNFGPIRLEPGSITKFTYDVLFDNDTSQIHYPCPSFSSLTAMANCVNAANVTGVNIPAAEKLTINFFPNPMGDAGTFSFKPNTVKEIKLYTVLGEQVRDYTGINGTTLQLQRGNLSAGIYFYSVIGKNGMVGNGKIVVQ